MSNVLMVPRPNSIPPANRLWVDEPADGNISARWLLAVARRQMKLVGLACVVALAAGLTYISVAAPLYTAMSTFLTDSRNVQSLEELTAAPTFGPDTGAVENEIEVVKSERVSMLVLGRLNLVSNPHFAEASGPSVWVRNTIRTLINPRLWFDRDIGGQGMQPEEVEQSILERLQRGLEIRRVGRTNMLQIRYTSADPQLAAKIANTYAEAYLREKLDSRFEAAQLANTWFQDRVTELQKQSQNADTAVQRYRAANNLVAANGQLVSDQQLFELNSQLAIARAQRATAEARYFRIKTITEEGNTAAIVSEALESPVINTIRAKYLESSRREADLSSRLGRNHIQAVNLREEMRQYQKQMLDELGRIAESYRSEYEVAKAKEQSTEQSLTGLMGRSAATNESLVKLRELEREAESLRALHQGFLKRFQEASQFSQSFPVTDARIVTEARVPLKPSFPLPALTLALSLLIGLVAGASAGLLREFNDRYFRTGAQVRSELNLEFLGMLPTFNGPRSAASTKEVSAWEVRSLPIMRQVIRAPLSGYAEALRSAKVVADLALHDGGKKIIGVTSLLPGEGKTTTAKNFASLLAQQGASTLLIDGDLRNPGLTRTLAPTAKFGLVDILSGNKNLDDTVLFHETATGMHFLPCVSHGLTQTSDLISSPKMDALLNDFGRRYDYVVIDLPPVGPIVDVKAAAGLLTAILFVVEWGRTPRRAVQTLMRTEPRIHERCLGVVFNNVDTKRLASYEAEDSKDYLHARYATYYNNPARVEG